MYRGEQKINLNLSEYAYNIVLTDMFQFVGKDNLSGFINMIISGHAVFSRASISNRYEDYCAELLAKMDENASDQVKHAIEKIGKAYRDKLVDELNSFEKGNTFKIRLNNDNYDYLYDLDDGGRDLVYYRGSVGRFVKAIVEDYARMHSFEREKVIHSELIQIVENAINAGKMF